MISLIFLYVFPGRISWLLHFISFFFFSFQHHCYEYHFRVVWGGCDEPVLCYCARIDLGFFSLFHYVIRWPALCHYREQAWVEAAGEQGSALSLSKILLRMCPSVCLSLHLSVSIYLSVFLSALSHFSSHSLSNANAQMQILSSGFSASGLKFYAPPPVLHVFLCSANASGLSL